MLSGFPSPSGPALGPHNNRKRGSLCSTYHSKTKLYLHVVSKNKTVLARLMKFKIYFKNMKFNFFS